MRLFLLLLTLAAAAVGPAAAATDALTIHLDRAWDREGSSRYHAEIETARVTPRCFAVGIRTHDESGRLQERKVRGCGARPSQ